METIFSIAGLTVKIQAPFSIMIDEAYDSFFSNNRCDGSAPTVRVQFHSAEQLPERPDGFFGDECRFYHKSCLDRTWFSLWPESEPFAFADFSQAPNLIQILYLASQMETVRSSRSLIRMIEPERLFNHFGGFMLHGSLIALPQGGLVFSGPSGIGKSTQASLWEKYAQAEILNGDRCAIMPRTNGWLGWGLPFAGTSGIYKNKNSNVKAVVLLEQAPENRLYRAGLREAFSFLYQQINHHRWNKELVAHTTDSLIQLLKDVPVYHLACRPDESAVALLRREVFGEV